MDGVFEFGDKLYIQTLALKNLHIGDIIAYKSLDTNGKEIELVHRIFKMNKFGLVTLGDGNLFPDSTPVNQRNYIGRVLFFEREGKRHYPKKNYRTRLKLLLLRKNLFLVYYVSRMLRLFLRYPYAMIRKSGFFKILWHPMIQKQAFQNDGKPLAKYIHEGSTIATYCTDTGRFTCKKPFDLLLWDKIQSKNPQK